MPEDERPKEQPKAETKEMSPEEQIEQLKQQLAEKNQEIENLKQENFLLRFDELTNLEQKRSFHKRVNAGIEKIITERPDVAEVLQKDEITAEDMEKMQDIEFTVAAADLAYLGKYNNDPEIRVATGGEHTGGDMILRETAALIQDVDLEKRTITPRLNTKTRGYRTGGDEFALLMDLGPEEAAKVTREFKIKQNTIEVPGADLPPMINIDTAHISEGIRAFSMIYEQSERKEMSTEDMAKKIQDFTTRIADRRAMVQKGRERLEMMVDMLESDVEKFDRNFQWTQKGAFGMEKPFFKDLLEQKNKSPENFPDVLAETVQRLLKEEKEKAIKQQAKEYAAVIEIADAKFMKAA